MTSIADRHEQRVTDFALCRPFGKHSAWGCSLFLTCPSRAPTTHRLTIDKHLIILEQETDMTIPRQSAATTRGDPMTALRKTALVAGIFYLITFISIPTLALYGNLKTDQNFITSAGSNTSVLWGAFLEVIVALAGIGTAVTLFPVVKRQNEGMALGFAAVRTLEAAMIFTGVLSLLTLVHLRQGVGTATGLDKSSLVTTGASLVSVYNGTALLGQTLMPCLSAVLLGTLMYRSRLVPRAIPLMGLIGAPLLIASTIAWFFGLIPQISAGMLIGTVPVALWELSLGLWLTFKGFKPSPITAGMTAAGTPPAYRQVVPA